MEAPEVLHKITKWEGFLWEASELVRAAVRLDEKNVACVPRSVTARNKSVKRNFQYSKRRLPSTGVVSSCAISVTAGNSLQTTGDGKIGYAVTL